VSESVASVGSINESDNGSTSMIGDATTLTVRFTKLFDKSYSSVISCDSIETRYVPIAGFHGKSTTTDSILSIDEIVVVSMTLPLTLKSTITPVSVLFPIFRTVADTSCGSL